MSNLPVLMLILTSVGCNLSREEIRHVTSEVDAGVEQNQNLSPDQKVQQPAVTTSPSQTSSVEDLSTPVPTSTPSAPPAMVLPMCPSPLPPACVEEVINPYETDLYTECCPADDDYWAMAGTHRSCAALTFCPNMIGD